MNQVLANLSAKFIAQYPAITLELDLSARRVDLIGENFDVAIRMGDLPDDATLAARKLAVFSVGFYASPGYLQQHGQPFEPEALMEHDSLHILRRSGESALWSLTRGGQSWQGSPPARASANLPETLLHLARQGLGDWQIAPVNAWAVFPGRRLMPTRTTNIRDNYERTSP
jgi:DNA-binding transcriptional LysR family regulator